MTVLYFVDSNVLLYHRDPRDPVKQQRAALWLTHLWQTRAGRVSIQVLQEFYAVVTRKMKPGMSPMAAQEEVEDYFTWQPLAMRPDVLQLAWQVEGRYGLSCWDSLIVATAQISGCRYLLSEDLQDGQQLLDVQVQSPFSHKPAA